MILEAELLHNLKELKNYNKLEILMSYYKKSPIEMIDDILGKIEIINEEEIKWQILMQNIENFIWKN
jgi:hypothetical protein